MASLLSKRIEACENTLRQHERRIEDAMHIKEMVKDIDQIELRLTHKRGMDIARLSISRTFLNDILSLVDKQAEYSETRKDKIKRDLKNIADLFAIM
ncbi:TPA: hypothetical protein NKS89_000357 [Vibrio parahaemolyticus]|uniref:Uncharacterized protein n=1 Tax=Vibrio parahaemolyticus TaxID=670 RepID=A0AA47LA10_VIBPH|nr:MULTISPECIES: hypothetical protein [Vibrio]AVF62001.1 hypothetical protein AL537_22170 [Vibrio diabolicus]EGR1951273.1 hypothetical protein [Vibrio parahaemolyticus]EII3081029.1 hypothetical protein [Vibrio parahaemolyticus]EIL2907590.1 hypothetical protein [Vibrio alginolyticus]ELJ8766198.1 hypothetical protein [Vibrio parahaemolyticus]